MFEAWRSTTRSTTSMPPVPAATPSAGWMWVSCHIATFIYKTFSWVPSIISGKICIYRVCVSITGMNVQAYLGSFVMSSAASFCNKHIKDIYHVFFFLIQYCLSSWISLIIMLLYPLLYYPSFSPGIIILNHVCLKVFNNWKGFSRVQ